MSDKHASERSVFGHEGKFRHTGFPLFIAISASLIVRFGYGICSGAIRSQPDAWVWEWQVLTSTYLQNFDCVDQPLLDLDFDGILAKSAPNEMQTPICQAVTEPAEDPSGGNIKHTAHLYVLVPMFGTSTNPDDAMPCPNPQARRALRTDPGKNAN